MLYGIDPLTLFQHFTDAGYIYTGLMNSGNEIFAKILFAANRAFSVKRSDQKILIFPF